MRRPPQYDGVAWDDPRWHVVRLVVDLMGGRYVELEADDIERFLWQNGKPVATGLLRYLESRPELLKPVAEHLAFRTDAERRIAALLRSEEEALADVATLTDAEVKTYGTKSADHHQSSKAMVQTIEVLTRLHCAEHGGQANTDPQDRAVVIDEGYLWVSPRRLDGAIPGLVNPRGIGEIKEYWGKTKGGSKMSDAIYEIQLVGLELRAFEREHGAGVSHYAIFDGKEQWSYRRSDLRRAVDLLCMGLIDELIAGREVLVDWPRILVDLAP